MEAQLPTDVTLVPNPFGPFSKMTMTERKNGNPMQEHERDRLVRVNELEISTKRDERLVLEGSQMRWLNTAKIGLPLVRTDYTVLEWPVTLGVGIILE